MLELELVSSRLNGLSSYLHIMQLSCPSDSTISRHLEQPLLLNSCQTLTCGPLLTNISKSATGMTLTTE